MRRSFSVPGEEPVPVCAEERLGTGHGGACVCLTMARINQRISKLLLGLSFCDGRPDGGLCAGDWNESWSVTSPVPARFGVCVIARSTSGIVESDRGTGSERMDDRGDRCLCCAPSNTVWARGEFAPIRPGISTGIQYVRASVKEPTQEVYFVREAFWITVKRNKEIKRQVGVRVACWLSWLPGKATGAMARGCR